MQKQFADHQQQKHHQRRIPGAAEKRGCARLQLQANE